MGRILVLLFGVVSYLAFFGIFVYFIGWTMGLVVPIDIDTFIYNDKLRLDRLAGSRGEAIMINVALCMVFAVQHTIMARAAFKEKLTKIIPVGAERSLFVLLAALGLALIMWQWRPMPEYVWNIDSGVGFYALHGLSLLGWGLLLGSSFLINHFSLFGLQQSYNHYTGKKFTPPKFVQPVVYNYLRHPIMLGVVMGMCFSPQMSQGHLVLAITLTVYVFIGIQFEERELTQMLGDDYTQYKKRVSMIIPMPPKNV